MMRAKRFLMQTEIVDGRLQRRLTAQYGRPIRRFLTPIEAPPRGNFAAAHSDTVATGLMPFVRFPEWHFCTRCRLLWKVPWNTPTNDARRRCNGQIRLSKGEAKFCADLKPDYRKPTLVPGQVCGSLRCWSYIGLSMDRMAPRKCRPMRRRVR